MKIEKLLSIKPEDSSFTKTTIFNDKNMLVFEINLKYNEEFPAFDHEGSSLLLYAVMGTGIVEIKDIKTEFVHGDLIYFAEDELFKIKNSCETPLYCFAAITPRPPVKEQYNELGI